MECDVDLLLVLDAAVKADPAFPGLAGAVCIGLSDEAGTRWWRATFGGRTHTETSRGLAPASDVVVRMSPEVAEAILTTGTLPASPAILELSGDRELLTRFAARYFSRKDLLTLRREKS